MIQGVNSKMTKEVSSKAKDVNLTLEMMTSDNFMEIVFDDSLSNISD
jgi:hypothetical protein